jgi:hypothetical protein
MGQGFSTHVLLCLDKDIERGAKATIDKDVDIKKRSADNCKWLACYDWSNANAESLEFMKGLLATWNSDVAPVKLDAESKITVYAHGGEGADLGFSLRQINPKNLARLVSAVVQGTKVKRVSLLGCFTGGKKTFRGVVIGPEGSVGYQFAKYAGNIAATVTARMGRSITENIVYSHKALLNGTPTSEKKLESAKQTVGHVWHGQQDKVIFTPNPEANLKKPLNPTWKYETYGKNV